MAESLKIRLDENLHPANVATLRQITSFSRPLSTLGNVSAGDGGARDYYFDPASVLADNGTTVVKPNSISSSEAGRWREAGRGAAAGVGSLAGVTPNSPGGNIALNAGTGIVITPNDSGDGITIAATGGGGGSAGVGSVDGVSPNTPGGNIDLIPGTGISITPNDAGDGITISATGGGTITGLTVIPTIADLKGATTGGLVNGDTRRVLGYHVAGDGGGGDFRWNSTSTTTDDGGVNITPNTNPAQGRWVRVMEAPLNVQWFGARGNDATADTLGFQRAIAYSKASSSKKAIEVPYVGQDYLITQELLLDEQKMFSHDPRATLRWPNDLGSNTYALTLVGSLNPDKKCILENLRFYGGGPKVFGSPPRQMHGIRAGRDGNEGENGAGNKPLLRNVETYGFNYGFVLDNGTGHITAQDCAFRECFYGVYVRRGNGDYFFSNCEMGGCTWASIGLPRNTGIAGALFERCQIGFSPYAIFQSNVDDNVSTGNRMPGFISNSVFIFSSFEGCGNGIIVSESTTDGAFNGNQIIDVYHNFSDDQKITSRDRNWAINVPYAEFNHIYFQNDPWRLGDLGLIRVVKPNGWAGANAWDIRGNLPTVPAGKVLIDGEKSYSNIRPYYHRDKEIYIPAGATSASYTLQPYEQAMTDNIWPIATPNSNPGSYHWVTSTTTTITVHLASPAPAGGVSFNVHVMP